MDSKWLRSYERATLYGEKREIIDYSPEIDTYLKVICFQTFRGHCGCILFDISEIEFTRNSSDAERALMLYFGKLPNKNDERKYHLDCRVVLFMSIRPAVLSIRPKVLIAKKECVKVNTEKENEDYYVYKKRSCRKWRYFSIIR